MALKPVPKFILLVVIPVAVLGYGGKMYLDKRAEAVASAPPAPVVEVQAPQPVVQPQPAPAPVQEAAPTPSQKADRGLEALLKGKK